MNTSITATEAGQFLLGGEHPINRLGFGTMRLTGEGFWGPPHDRPGALEVLRRLPALGVNFIDTADAYGPDVTEPLIREALHPYPNLVVATKGGLVRTGPMAWRPLGRPEYLIQQAKKSCVQLGVDQIALWQLHRIDPNVPRDEQFGAVKALLDEGVIRYAGLSEVGVDDLEAALSVFPVATVQNLYNLFQRQADPVLALCERHGIGFIPWRPLAGYDLSHHPLLDAIALTHGATPGQVALAWLLKRSPMMLPIPGTSTAAHLEENVASARIVLSNSEFDALTALAS